MRPPTGWESLSLILAHRASLLSTQVIEMYQISEFGSTIEFLQQIGRRFGKVKKGGVPDILAAAKIILQVSFRVLRNILMLTKLTLISALELRQDFVLFHSPRVAHIADPCRCVGCFYMEQGPDGCL